MFVLPVETVAQYCNPFEGCWLDVDTPITMEEVRHILETREEALTDTSFVMWEGPEPGARERHARKIAFFVRYGYEQPIDIDVGIPSMGCSVDYIVQDGNHRLASDIYRWKMLGEARQSPVLVAGDIAHARELGLWPVDTLEPDFDDGPFLDWMELRYGGVPANEEGEAEGYFVTHHGAPMYYARLRDALGTWVGEEHLLFSAPLEQQLVALGLQHYFELGTKPTPVPYSLSSSVQVLT